MVRFTDRFKVLKMLIYRQQKKLKELHKTAEGIRKYQTSKLIYNRYEQSFNQRHVRRSISETVRDKTE